MIRVIAGPDGWVHTIIKQDGEIPLLQLPANEGVLDREPPIDYTLLTVDPETRQVGTPHDRAVIAERLQARGLTEVAAAQIAATHDPQGLPNIRRGGR